MTDPDLRSRAEALKASLSKIVGPLYPCLYGVADLIDALQAECSRLQALADQANDRYIAMATERDRMRHALYVISRQRLAQEVPEHEREDADYQHGYEACVTQARAAMNEHSGGRGDA